MRVMVLRDLLPRIGTAEGRIVAVLERQKAADAVGGELSGVGLGQLVAGVRVFTQVQDDGDLHVQLKAYVPGGGGVVPGPVKFGAKTGAWLGHRVSSRARGMSCIGVCLSRGRFVTMSLGLVGPGAVVVAHEPTEWLVISLGELDEGLDRRD